MKLEELSEMAIHGGDRRAQSDLWAANIEKFLSDKPDNSLIGKFDLDDLDIRQRLMLISVWDSSGMVGALEADNIPNHYCIIDNLWVRSDYRGKKLMVKLLLFLKNERGYNKLALGDVHSSDTYNILRSGGFRAFKKHWEKGNGETAVFSVDTLDSFYKAGQWRLVLENTEDLNWLIKKNSFTHTYDSLAHAVSVHESLK